MSTFLRDRYINNLSLNHDRLSAISNTFLEIANTSNRGLPDNDPNRVSVLYLIRFDNKGFLLNNFATVLDYHKNSRKTERINFLLESGSSRATNGQVGKRADLRLDALNAGNCTLTVQDDDAVWTDSTFCRIDEELAKYGNKNFLIRSAWTPFIVQILGVIAGFLLSLWAALRISPNLSIEYSFIVTFVLGFLVFSNTWTYVNQQILRFFDYIFPNITFKESKGLHWLGRAFVGAVFIAAAFYLLDALFGFVGRLLKEVLK